MSQLKQEKNALEEHLYVMEDELGSLRKVVIQYRQKVERERERREKREKGK